MGNDLTSPDSKAKLAELAAQDHQAFDTAMREKQKQAYLAKRSMRKQ